MTRRKSNSNVSAPPPVSHPVRQIELRGVRVHNLKQIDLDIPLGKLVVLSGVSGSGKSSLAFDTIFAEGQRRYIESFSASARQYLERIERPNADRIAHVPPTIAIRTDASQRHLSARTTVASLAEIDTAIRRLFARVGRVICPRCQCEVRPSSSEDVVQLVGRLPEVTRFQLCFRPASDDSSTRNDLAITSPSSDSTPTSPSLRRGGRKSSGSTDVSPLGKSIPDATTWKRRGFTRAIFGGTSVTLDQVPGDVDPNDVWVVVDRLSAGKAAAERIVESAETAFREGDGRCVMLVSSDEARSVSSSLSVNRPFETRVVDERTWDVVSLSRYWDCPGCHREFLPPEPRLFEPGFDEGCASCKSATAAADGAECTVCFGTRLGERALAVRIGQRRISDLLRMTAEQASAAMKELSQELTEAERTVAAHLLQEIDRRLGLMIEIGLGHLTLLRAARTLSEGQVRRLMLVAAIGSRVTGTLCLVDEPSAGLTLDEIPPVIRLLRRLLEQRNSVIAVDHAPQVIKAADHVIELGPGAGPTGGNVVFAGPPNTLHEDADLAAHQGDTTEKTGKPRQSRAASEWIVLTNVRHRNVQNLTFRFPLGQLCVVTGPGGSGKTSLVIETLLPALQDRLGHPASLVRGRFDSLEGGKSLVDVVVVDRMPLTRSSRSNAATWIDVFDEIRDVFAMTAEAKQRGFGPQHFSFNAAQGGRCRACRGTGVLRHDMQFLPDVALPCPECGGTRYRREILDVRYRGRSVAEVLQMSSAEAAIFFRNHPRLQGRLQMLKQIGLDYLVLGQATDTLSGGEAQRLKLASRLTTGRGPTLIVCDEATIGLHPSDVMRLIGCFDELIAIGHSVLVIDNNPDLLNAADTIVTMSSDGHSCPSR